MGVAAFGSSAFDDVGLGALAMKMRKRPVAPPPPIDADADLRQFLWMKWPLDATFNSEDWLAATSFEKLARAQLICAAWKSVPASSLPNDEQILKKLSGAGGQWPRVRDFALKGFKLHADGRLYQPALSKLAGDAWKTLLSSRKRQQAFRARRGNSNREEGRFVTVTQHVMSLKAKRSVDKEKDEYVSGMNTSLPPEVPWESRVRTYHSEVSAGKTKPFWHSNNWGPPPDQPGTRVPMKVLIQFGYRCAA